MFSLFSREGRSTQPQLFSGSCPRGSPPPSPRRPAAIRARASLLWKKDFVYDAPTHQRASTPHQPAGFGSQQELHNATSRTSEVKIQPGNIAQANLEELAQAHMP